MNTATPGQLLEQEHRRIDAGILGILDGSGGQGGLADALALLQRHIFVEERLLFPPLEERGLGMPVFVMKREHGQMWPMLQRLLAAGATTGEVAALQADCRNLHMLLQIHNTKEEQILYSAADRIAAQDPGSLSCARLQAAQMPAGWRCALAAH